MKESTKRILAVVGIILVSVAIRGTVSYIGRTNAAQEKSVFQYSKAEYIDQATIGCSKDGTPESVCRCFYQKFLENHTVQETLKFDAEATANPDGFEFTQEQASIFAGCME